MSTVGVLVSDIQNPHFATLVGAIEEALYAREARVLFCNSGEDSAKQSSYLEVMAAERVMGVVISPTAEGDLAVARLMDRGTPVVAIDRPVADPRADLVVSDNAAATAAGTRLLVDSGRQHIGWIGGREGVWTTTERLAGYLATMQETGLEPITALREFSLEMGYRATEMMLDEHPELDGLVIANNQMAIGALQALRASGRPGSRKLSAWSPSTTPPWANLVEPPLTTIAQPIREIARGRRGAALPAGGGSDHAAATDHPRVPPADPRVRGRRAPRSPKRLGGAWSGAQTSNSRGSPGPARAASL